jgi:tetratricopeptide (TPR) repeat protein
VRASRVIPLGAAAIFLLLAYFSGAWVRDRFRVDISGNMGILESGLKRLERVAASALYLQLDDYHHIGMYQGQRWTEITDYLPQAWLVARLDHSFAVVYADIGNHLAVNLGRVDQGLAFAAEGVRYNPDSLNIVYEYAFLLFETGRGTPGETARAVLDYNSLLRRFDGDRTGRHREASACMILGEALSGEMPGYAELYRNRSEFLNRALRAGVYYPGFFRDPPDSQNGGDE